MEAINRARARIECAEKALAQAKLEHEAEFRQRLVDLFNEYGLSVEANGSEGARLEIHEITHTFTLQMLDF